MKKTEKPNVVINYFNTKVVIKTERNFLPIAIKIVVAFVLAIAFILAVLIISQCCPDSLADFIRWILSIVISN